VDREFVPHFPGVHWRCEARMRSSITWWFARREPEEAAFGEVSYRLTDAWQVTAGGRANSSTRLISRASSPCRSSMRKFRCRSTYRIRQRGSIFKLNTSYYRFTPDLMMYATVSDGYRKRRHQQRCRRACCRWTPAVQHVCALAERTELQAGPDSQS